MSDVISPTKTDDKVVVVGMADEGECEKEMFVYIRREMNDLAVPLQGYVFLLGTVSHCFCFV